MKNGSEDAEIDGDANGVADKDHQKEESHSRDDLGVDDGDL